MLLAITLEKSPIRSLGSLSKMFSMVPPLGEDVRDKDWCRSCNKPKVEVDTKVLTELLKISTLAMAGDRNMDDYTKGKIL